MMSVQFSFSLENIFFFLSFRQSVLYLHPCYIIFALKEVKFSNSFLQSIKTFLNFFCEVTVELFFMYFTKVLCRATNICYVQIFYTNKSPFPKNSTEMYNFQKLITWSQLSIHATSLFLQFKLAECRNAKVDEHHSANIFSFFLIIFVRRFKY